MGRCIRGLYCVISTKVLYTMAMAKVTLTDDRPLTQLSDEELEILIAQTQAALTERLNRRQQFAANEQVVSWIIVAVVLILVVAWTFVFREWFAPVASPRTYTQMRAN